MLSKLDSDFFFRLVADLVGSAVDCGLYHAEGQAVATNIVDLAETGELTSLAESTLADIPHRVGKIVKKQGGCLYRSPIADFAGAVIGDLIVAVRNPLEDEQQQDRIFIHSLDTVVSLIEKQLQLESELESMASELVGRYEELNLIYHSEDEIRDIDRDGRALRRLIDQCVEHLSVAFVALCIPRQDRILCSYSDSETVPDSYQLVRKMQAPLIARLESEKGGFILNDGDDPLRRQLDVRYKLLCTPVVDSLGRDFGMLLCFNKPEQSDFFNSDRSLLKVVGRKVAKIVQANYDELTGIYNRRAFETIVEKALLSSSERGISHSLLNVNLDQLKVVNDAIGRDAGSWIIERTAIVLQNELRETDSIGYLGDGKYGVLLERCDLDNGARVAEQLRLSVHDAALDWNGRRIDLTVTVGVSLIEPNTASTDEALEAAEIALNGARQSGADQVRVFSNDDEYVSAHKKQVHWANYLQSALRENKFQIYAQSIRPVSPADAQRFYFEALLRLIDENGNVVTPDTFLLPAEKFNLMPQVDRWVINATFECLARSGFAQVENQGTVSINLSGQSVANDELADYIADKLKQHRIEPSCICFEITETAAIEDFSCALKVLTQIREAGCQLALDDFGTGLSSFSYLQKLPVNYVKIDGSFVKVLLQDDVSHAMVTSINHVSHVMGLKTVAEFVESDAIFEELKSIGVDYVQGNRIASPLPILECLSAVDLSNRTGTG